MRLLLALTLLAPAHAAAQNIEPPEAMFPYAKAGPAVTGPTRFLSSPVYGAGFMAGALFCLPVSIAQDPRMEGKVSRDRQASIVCGKSLGVALSWPVYAAVGLPIVLVKGLFWDAPRALLGSGKKE